MPQQRKELRLVGRPQATQQFHDPAFMLDGHREELPTPFCCQSHGDGAAVLRIVVSLQQPFGHQAIGQAGNVAARHHQAL